MSSRSRFVWILSGIRVGVFFVHRTITSYVTFGCLCVLIVLWVFWYWREWAWKLNEWIFCGSIKVTNEKQNTIRTSKYNDDVRHCEGKWWLGSGVNSNIISIPKKSTLLISFMICLSAFPSILPEGIKFFMLTHYFLKAYLISRLEFG